MIIDSPIELHFLLNLLVLLLRNLLRCLVFSLLNVSTYRPVVHKGQIAGCLLTLSALGSLEPNGLNDCGVVIDGLEALATHKRN